MSDQTDRGQDAERDTSLTLLQRLRGNDTDAWQQMVHLYGPLLHHWCDRAQLQRADAEDVIQEVLRSVAAHLDGFRRDRAGDTFRGWLRIITRNAILQHFRRQGRQPPAQGGTDAYQKLQEMADTLAADVSEPEAEMEADGLRCRALELVRGEFEPRTWQMFWLTFTEERSPVDVAADMGVTPAAVRKAKSRVLRRFKQEFADLI